MNKARLVCVCVLSLFSALATAQESQEFRKELKSLAFTEKELDAVEAIVANGEADIVKAQGEIKVIQVRLESQMKAKYPPLAEIKKLVRESLEWEYQIRILKIERNIAIRQVIGDERWGKAFKLARRFNTERKTGKEGADSDEPKDGRGLRLLEALL